MTTTQFQTFLQQLDASLKQISTEVSQEQMDLSTQLFMKAILMKMRVAFGMIGKQISRQKGEARVAAEPEELIEEFTPTDLYYQNEEWLREAFA